MRWIFLILLLISTTLFGGYVFLKGYPYRLYSQWVYGNNWNKFYSISDYKPLYLSPAAITPSAPYTEDYAQLWKDFPLKNARIPLPIRHPLLQTVPILESGGEKTLPHIGISLLNPNDREIFRVYTLPMTFAQDHSQGQDLFKLPFVRNRILKLSIDEVWKGIFSHKIIPKSKSLDEMIYDLYILHLRSKILPKETIKYGFIKDNKAIIEILSKDNDYTVELVMSQSNGNIFSFIIRTEKNNPESVQLRSKYVENLSFSPADESMAKILYKEFKSLNFARQIDQEGMLYLLSAWSQNTDNLDLFKELVLYLERGQKNKLQLKPIYAFAYKHYGKTYTTKDTFHSNEDQNVVLQRRIEIEKSENDKEAKVEKERPVLAPELTPEERMNIYLKKAKQAPVKTKDMVIH